MYKIITDFEGANLKVLSCEEGKAQIEVELRDTTEDWFYWCFKVEGANGKTVTFEFPNNNRVGYYGAAVSHDFKNWHWQYDDACHNGNSFTYTFGNDETEVYFAHDFCYRPQRFFEFARENNIKIKTLCKSEKGRDVPFTDTETGEKIIMLTARHHACESTGSYILEGVLKELLSDPFFSEYRIICVPMVDYDGVCDGDQGKSRAPFDHNRDYKLGESARYNTVKEIRRIGDGGKVQFSFDFHSPWHLGGENDLLYVPIKKYEKIKEITRFSKLFEAENSEDAFLHFSNDNMMPDVSWNTANDPTNSTFFTNIGAELAFTLETPYFKVSDVAFSAERAINSGKAFVRALKKYVNKKVKIAFTGDILYQMPMNELCAKGDSYDYRQILMNGFSSLLDCDYLVANTETPFAGEGFGYTNERYQFNTPTKALKNLKHSGVDLLTMANNHCMDRDYEGLVATCENIERIGMDYIGISKGERNSVFIKNFSKLKIAFVNATYGTNAFHHHNLLPKEKLLSAVSMIQPEEDLEGATHLLESNPDIEKEVKALYENGNPFAEPMLKALENDIKLARKNSDYIIMLLHCGGQYNLETEAYTKLVCEKIKAMGADMVIVNHPHIILPSAFDKNGVFTAYCLGNLQQTNAHNFESCPINSEYSALLYLEFDENRSQPQISFSIMRNVVEEDGVKPPKVYNAYDYFKLTGDAQTEKDIIFYANRFMPNMNYTEAKPEYIIK